MQPRLLREPLRLAGAPILRLQSDDRLLALARAGHDPAFAAIVDRYRGPLMRYCSRLVGEGRAEDVLQQALLNAHAGLQRDDRPIELKPWLYRITHNAALNSLRGQHREAQLDEEQPGDDEVAETVERRERLRGALATIDGLPRKQRDALLLRELEGRSHVEIAAALGVTAGAARQHLLRARMAVRQAATAITPYPLASRAAAWLAESDGLTRLGGAAMGAGVGATAKAAAGIMATAAASPGPSPGR